MSRWQIWIQRKPNTCTGNKLNSFHSTPELWEINITMPICPSAEYCAAYNDFIRENNIVRHHLKIHKRSLKRQPMAKLVLLRHCLDTYTILRQCTCCVCDIQCLPCCDGQQMNYAKQIMELMITMEPDPENQHRLHLEYRDLLELIQKRSVISPPLATDVPSPPTTNMST